jgi:glyoxylase-like metal-dependent hydrolase (beta-lactamase superfamily II)
MEIAGTIAMQPGDCVCCGSLVVRACELSGHYTPALGFHIEGLSRPVLVTGDALFAGSIGGCGTPEIYQLALRTLRATLAALPDETVLLPGHGSATTLGEERVSNPFL